MNSKDKSSKEQYNFGTQISENLIATNVQSQPIFAAPPTDDTSDFFINPDINNGFNLTENRQKWPQPGGLGTPVTITYSYSNLLDSQIGISPIAVRSAIEEALELWAEVAPLNFEEVTDLGELPTDNEGDIDSSDNYNGPAGTADIRFGYHSIDGAGINTLAHAAFPPPNSQSDIDGDIHFDIDNDFSLDANIGGTGADFLEVAVHEIGHAIGLNHISAPAPLTFGLDAILNPVTLIGDGRYSGPGTAFLLPADIEAVRRLYGTGTGSVEPLVSSTIDNPLVSTLDDNIDGDLSFGNLSLREAIFYATPDIGNITFDSSLFGGTINLDSAKGSLIIDKSIRISGGLGRGITVNGDGQNSVFVIDDGNSGTTPVIIDGLNITGGGINPNGIATGGGILNSEDLFLNNSTIFGNNSTFGGGIYNLGSLSLETTQIYENTANLGGGIFNLSTGSLNLSRVYDNIATNDGGGIFNSGTLDLERSEISSNVTGKNGGGIVNTGTINIEVSSISDNTAANNGGGISNGTTGILTLDESNVVGNTANNNGGGIVNQGTLIQGSANFSSDSSSSLTNNTALQNGGGIHNTGIAGFLFTEITGNVANVTGGAVFNNGETAIVSSVINDNIAVNSGAFYNQNQGSIIQSTVHNNASSSNNPIIRNFGGNLDIDNSTIARNRGGIINSLGATTNLFSSIVAQNGNDLIGTFNSRGFNLIGTGDNQNGITDGVNNDLVGTTETPLDPMLGEFQDNGGVTPTLALLPNSPAINTGSNTIHNDDQLADQRGAEGGIVFNRTAFEATDIGAFELQEFELNTPTIIDPVVTTLNDEFDGNFAPGDLSLREAIFVSNPGGLVTFDESLSGGAITLSMGELLIDKNLTVRGLGSDNLAIDGNGRSGIFFINDGDGDTDLSVTIEDLTITNGSSQALGGAISSSENLTVNNSVISSNSAISGGGISGSRLTVIRNSTITNNRALVLGGGIANLSTGETYIIDSTITRNNAEFGGGIVNNNSSSGDGKLFLFGSTVSENVATNSGGIRNLGEADIFSSTINNNASIEGTGGVDNISNAVLNITNSTISGNTGLSTGAINNPIGNTVDIRNSTIVENSTLQQVGAVGGIRAEFLGTNGSATLTSSIVANNDRVDISGNFNSGGNNLIGNGRVSIGNLSNGINGNLVGTAENPIDPMLGNLQDNGGNTQTHALLPGSLAIDAGSNPNNLNNDQRGNDFDRVASGSIDIGAFELQEESITNEVEITDFLESTGTNDRLIGTRDDETINGLAGDDFIRARGGNDLINGGRDNDRIQGGNGNDTLRGNVGNDKLNGGAGDDLIKGGKGNDRLIGRQGNDTLLGGQGKDTIKGGGGNDLIEGGLGKDVLFGQGGKDTFVLALDAGEDLIKDFGFGNDLLGLSGGLTFDELTFTDNAIFVGSQSLAAFDGFNAKNLTKSDFVAM